MMDSPLKGHMVVKSGPFAPTDAKLTSQYMVLDHMNAHYKKLSKAKSAVDCSAPKAWLVSQKVRDQARREAMKREMKRRDEWLNHDHNHLDSYRDSEADRHEMFAHMRSYQDLPEAGPDELDGGRRVPSNYTMEAHASSSSAYKPDARDLQLINKMVEDPHTSPSKYHSATQIRSNIPTEGQSANRHNHHHHQHHQHHQKVHGSPPNARRPHTPRTYQQEEYTNGYLPVSARAQKPLTPRSGDLLDQHDHKFTHPEKPFAPRTLKTKSKTQSKISSLKCYNPPKKAATPRDDADGKEQSKESRTGPPKPAPRDRRGSTDALRSTKGSMKSRPGTPYSEVDWMNETLMSRDGSQAATPAGVPALDISLDADHVKWLKEQTRKAHVRSSARTSRSEADELGSTWGSQRAGRTQTLGMDSSSTHTQQMNGTYERPQTMSMSGTYDAGRQPFTLSGSINKTTGYIPKSARSARIEKEEEELKYLEFIQEVTNDVLDRNIYTNRVLKNVFESHIEKRKHELRISKMREMLDDLRLDLGIPDTDDEDSMGLKFTTMEPEISHARRKARAGKHYTAASSSSSHKLPNLRHSNVPKRSASPDAKPPLPRPGSRGSTKRPDSATSSLRGSGEFQVLTEEPTTAAGGGGGVSSGEDLVTTGTGSSTFGMITALQTNEQSADILTIQHAEEVTRNNNNPGVDETDRGGLDETKEAAQEGGDAEQGLDETDKAVAEETAKEGDEDYEMPPKFKMVDDMTLTYQLQLEDDLDDEGVSDSAEEEDAGREHGNMQTLAPIMEVDTPKEKSPRPPGRPTPKRRTSLTPRNNETSKDTPRSQARTNTTSDTLDISDLDEDEEDDF